jgi:hypothetical protein
MVPNFAAMPTGLMFQRDSQLIEPFNIIIAERLSFISEYLKTRGFYSRACYQHFFPEEIDLSAGFNALNIKEMFGAFFLLMLLSALACVSFMLELYWGRRRRQNNSFFSSSHTT